MAAMIRPSAARSKAKLMASDDKQAGNPTR